MHLNICKFHTLKKTALWMCQKDWHCSGVLLIFLRAAYTKYCRIIFKCIIKNSPNTNLVLSCIVSLLNFDLSDIMMLYK